MLVPAPRTVGCDPLEIFNRQSVLDNASNESFLKEEVAGALGLKQLYQTIKVHELSNSVETFQTMPLRVTIESVNRLLTKEIEVKTCQEVIKLKIEGK